MVILVNGYRLSPVMKEPTTCEITKCDCPALKGERDTKGWRGGAAPYPQLGEGLRRTPCPAVSAVLGQHLAGKIK